jgi:hypothetical protein
VIQHEFTELIPNVLQKDTLYVSIKYQTAVHLCACGCGNKVVTPISPADWALIFDGDTVSLYPSIGNWQFPCQSHYWIRSNKIIWSKKWTPKEIERGRQRDFQDQVKYFDEDKSESNHRKMFLSDEFENIEEEI